MPPHVITKAEAEYALDRVEFDRMLERRGEDTILMWWRETTLRMSRRGRKCADVSPSTPGDPRR